MQSTQRPEYSGQIDRFAHERLPAPELWPELRFDRPELQFGERLNLVTWLFEHAAAAGSTQRPMLRSPLRTLSYAPAEAQVNRWAHVLVDDLGLVPALRGLVDDFSKRTRIDATLACSDTLRPLPDEQQVVIYRVVQEALTNVARHAGAHRVEVRIATEDDRVRLAVEDDGRGVSGEPIPHLGLLGIRERVTTLGGTLMIDGHSGAGFRIEADIPAGVAS